MKRISKKAKSERENETLESIVESYGDLLTRIAEQNSPIFSDDENLENN